MIKNLSRRWLSGAALGILVASAPVPVLAHADLLSAEPAVDSKVETAPKELRLTFNEAIELAFSKVTLTDAAGEQVEHGDLALDPADGKIMIVPLDEALAAGTYAVEWNVVATDTHKSEGKYAFEVQP